MTEAARPDRNPAAGRMSDDREEWRVMPKIVPFLWFNDQAEAAMDFYISIFKNSRVTGVSRYGEAGPGPKGAVMVATFQLEGQDFHAINGGPQFTFTPAISLLVNCETQEEVDHLCERLSAGGEPNQCGWLKDRYGLSWQIVPAILGTLMQDRDPVKSQRVMKAMLQMKKLDIAQLKQAYEQG
jgi:predicted 3-demethylubiquinone-9 3-methyltransferase (glyoxalase superfamily)